MVECQRSMNVVFFRTACQSMQECARIRTVVNIVSV
jgi:hypothetical protein